MKKLTPSPHRVAGATRAVALSCAAALTVALLALAPLAAAATPRDELVGKYHEDRALALPADPAGAAEAAGGGGGLARTIFGLAIVVAVIFGVHWVLKQVQAGRAGRATGGGLASVGSVPLGANRAVHLVRAGDDLVLLGVTEKAIVPVRAWSGEEAAALLASMPAADDDDEPSGGAGAPRPAAALRNVLDRLRERTVRR